MSALATNVEAAHQSGTIETSPSQSKVPLSLDPVEQGKKVAAIRAIDDILAISPLPKSLGVGSGSTMIYAVDHLKTKAIEHNYTFRCVPTSFQSRQLIIAARPQLILSSLEEEAGSIDVAFDGADEVDENLNCIKGGGACMLQEKCVAAASNYELHKEKEMTI